MVDSAHEFLVSVFILLVFGAIGCSGAQEESKRVFRYNQPNKITSLDPAFAKSQNNIWAVDHIYDGLVSLDSDMNIVPDLAKDWRVLEEGKVYEFRLRTDVFFHEDECFGEKKTRLMVADDFVYSFGRILDTTVLSPGSWIFEDRVEVENPFIAVDDSTLQIRLQEPFVPFLGILTMGYCSVVPREAVDYYQGEFRAHPVGTGSYRIKRWIENQGLFLQRHERYDHPVLAGPHLDGIRIDFIEDRKTAYLEFLRGNLDYLSGLDNSFINDLLDKQGRLLPKHDHKFVYVRRPYLNTEYIGINRETLPEEHPLQDIRIRRAMNLAVDREAMLRDLRNNVGRPALHGFIPEGLPSYHSSSENQLYFDPAEARGLVDEYRKEKGAIIPLQIHVNRDYLDIVTFLAEAWLKVGIPCEIQLQQSALLREGMRQGDLNLFRASWIADYPDGESFLNVFYGRNPAPPNYTRFRNQAFDELYLRSLSEVNDSVRLSMNRRMNDILLQELPVIFLYYDQTAVFYRKELEGVEINAFNLLKVDNIAINE